MDGIRGINPNYPHLKTYKPLWQLKIDQSVPFVPGVIFFDVAKSFDENLSNPNYFSAGFVLGLLLYHYIKAGVVRIILVI